MLFCFYMFYWFYPVFLDGESKYFKRKVAETQSFFFFFTNTECTKETKAFFAEAQQAKASRLFCVFRVQIKFFAPLRLCV